MVSKVHNIHQVKLHQSGGSAIHLAGMTRSAIRTGAQVRAEPTSGNPYAEFVSLVAASPGFDVSTKHLTSWLAQTGTIGLAVLGGSNPGLVAYTQNNTDGGTRTGSTTHNSHTMAKGLLLPMRLACEHQGDAQLDLSAIAVSASTGDTNPLVKAEAVALPTAQTDAVRFSLGPLQLGSYDLSGHCRSIEVNFGIQADALSACSDVYPTMSRIGSILPTITFRGINPDWYKESGGVPAKGLICTHANSYFYFRRRAAGGTYSSGSDHLKLTFAGMAVVDGGFDGSGNAVGEVSLTVSCVYDGSNVPLIFTADQALP